MQDMALKIESSTLARQFYLRAPSGGISERTFQSRPA